MKIGELLKLTIKLRIDVLKMTNRAASGHIGGSLSALDLIAALFFGEFEGRSVFKFNPKKPQWEERDYFILSKGHACPALYAILAEAGFFPKEELNHLRRANSLLQGHPVIKIPGVEMTTGSLGQGLSVSVGLALALKQDRKPNRVYCMIGDGESQEGQIWEAAMAAAHYKLDNLCAILDFNGLQLDGSLHKIMELQPVQDKFAAFGWKVFPLVSGHDLEEIIETYVRARLVKRRPALILAPTIKGRGVPFAENKVSYHGVALSDEEMAEAIPILEKQLKDLEEGREEKS